MFQNPCQRCRICIPEDVRIVTDTYASILDIQFEDIRQGDYVWVGTIMVNLGMEHTNTQIHPINYKCNKR